MRMARPVLPDEPRGRQQPGAPPADPRPAWLPPAPPFGPAGDLRDPPRPPAAPAPPPSRVAAGMGFRGAIAGHPRLSRTQRAAPPVRARLEPGDPLSTRGHPGPRSNRFSPSLSPASGWWGASRSGTRARSSRPSCAATPALSPAGAHRSTSWPRSPAGRGSPPPGTALRSCYASHRAIDGDAPAVFAALLRALYNRAVVRGAAYLLIGLDAADPLRSVLTGYRTLPYLSDLYLAAWEDGEAAASQVDGRLAGPEIAVL